MESVNPGLSDRELLIRIDTKLDGVIEAKNDHETRLRSIEDRASQFVTGKQLWGGLAGVLATVSGAVPLINWIINR